MSKINKRLEKLALRLPEIYLPEDKVDLEKWAVVACDQYSSDVEYWKSVERQTEGKPSTLNLIYPECYLDEKNPESRIKNINLSMKSYLDNGILVKHNPAFYLVERTTPNGLTRHGLIAALDLECYDYSKDSTSLIRATEGTIQDRIPPRKKIRVDAPLELPHIIVLIDDPEKSIIEPLVESSGSFPKIYDFDLMKNGGHLKGYKIEESKTIESIVSAFENMADLESFNKKYNSSDLLLYAMGDGNHSLATAKAVWEEVKQKASNKDEIMDHPARWALVEIENIHDSGIVFEPIHRVLFNASPKVFMDTLKSFGNYKFTQMDNLEDILKVLKDQSLFQKIGYCDENTMGVLEIDKPWASIPAGTIQKVIDTYLSNNKNAKVDYIHGKAETYAMGSRKGNIGIFLPAISKETFFRTIIKDRSFPRKTFSMGEANEKRYYMECRKITR